MQNFNFYRKTKRVTSHKFLAVIWLLSDRPLKLPEGEDNEQCGCFVGLTENSIKMRRRKNLPAAVPAPLCWVGALEKRTRTQVLERSARGK